jgi:type IV secretion system protein VirB8
MSSRELEVDLEISRERERRVLIWLVVLSLLVAIVAIVASVLRPPVTKYEPFVVRVDNTNGVVDSMVRIEDGKVDYGELVSQYFAERYVQCRESYTRFTYAVQYKECMLFTAQQTREGIVPLFNVEDPGSYYKRFGEAGKAVVTTRYYTHMPQNMVQVHFILEETIPGEPTKTSHWVSTIEYLYRNDGFASLETRKINPLGFQVINYRRDQEVVKEVVKEVGK